MSSIANPQFTPQPTPDLNLKIEGVTAEMTSVAPEIRFSLRIEDRHPMSIQTILLYCQIQLDAPQRGYSVHEQRQLVELFGPREQWGRSMRRMIWANTSVIVLGFTGSTIVDIRIPCSFDFNVGTTKYFAALEGGEVPVTFYFNGTVLYFDDKGGLKATTLSWDTECHFQMQVEVWREAMERHYRNFAWLCLRKDVFDKLRHYKMSHGFATFEDAVEDAIR